MKVISKFGITASLTEEERNTAKEGQNVCQHKGVGLFGVLDYQNGTVQCDAYAELNAQAFEGKHILMILDNSKIHHAKILEPILKGYRRD